MLAKDEDPGMTDDTPSPPDQLHLGMRLLHTHLAEAVDLARALDRQTSAAAGSAVAAEKKATAPGPEPLESVWEHGSEADKAELMRLWDVQLAAHKLLAACEDSLTENLPLPPDIETALRGVYEAFNVEWIREHIRKAPRLADAEQVDAYPDGTPLTLEQRVLSLLGSADLDRGPWEVEGTVLADCRTDPTEHVELIVERERSPGSYFWRPLFVLPVRDRPPGERYRVRIAGPVRIAGVFPPSHSAPGAAGTTAGDDGGLSD